MHVCTQRHTHFPILASEIVTLSQTSCTPAFAYRLPPVFHLPFFRAQQEEARRQPAVSDEASESTRSALVQILKLPGEVSEIADDKRPRFNCLLALIAR